MKRLFDLFFSFFGIILLLPLGLFIAFLVCIDSSGGVFFKQKRAGKNEKYFNLLKFRSMTTGADKSGLLTVGAADSRVTKIGLYLRKYKLDELPQFINVFLGQMSIVGPRPEVKKYVEMYTETQKQVFAVRPGLTDYASVEYFSENELLAKSSDPEKTYVEEILPAKLELNLQYIQEKSLLTDLKIIFKTLAKIVG